MASRCFGPVLKRGWDCSRAAANLRNLIESSRARSGLIDIAISSSRLRGSFQLPGFQECLVATQGGRRHSAMKVSIVAWDIPKLKLSTFRDASYH